MPYQLTPSFIDFYSYLLYLVSMKKKKLKKMAREIKGLMARGLLPSALAGYFDYSEESFHSLLDKHPILKEAFEVGFTKCKGFYEMKAAEAAMFGEGDKDMYRLILSHNFGVMEKKLPVGEDLDISEHSTEFIED